MTAAATAVISVLRPSPCCPSLWASLSGTQRCCPVRPSLSSRIVSLPSRRSQRPQACLTPTAQCSTSPPVSRRRLAVTELTVPPRRARVPCARLTPSGEASHTLNQRTDAVRAVTSHREVVRLPPGQAMRCSPGGALSWGVFLGQPGPVGPQRGRPLRAGAGALAPRGPVAPLPLHLLQEGAARCRSLPIRPWPFGAPGDNVTRGDRNVG